MTLEKKTEIVVTPQLDLPVLGDRRDQGGRRHLRFRDAVALLRETQFEDWPHLGSRASKEFLTSIRDGSGNLENNHTNWMYRSGVSDKSAVCHSHAILCESLRLFISHDQVDVTNLAGVEQIVRRNIQDERAVRKNPKHPDCYGLEFVLNQASDMSGAASTTVVNRWYAQTQRDESVVLKNARQHREEVADEAKRQNGGGEGSVIPPPRRNNDVVKVEGVARRRLSSPSTRSLASDCRSRSSCQFAQIAFCPGIFNRDWFASRRSSGFFERV